MLALRRLVFAITLVSLSVVHAGTTRPLTLVLQFDGERSRVSLEEMKRELTNLMDTVGIRIDFRLKEDLAPSDPINDLVVVRFKGDCRMDPIAIPYDERGPLAFTHTSDGHVLPFSEVACDRVKNSVNKALWGAKHKQADMLLGRALGRVIAHELHHIVKDTAKHESKGIAQTSLSAPQLITEHLPHSSEPTNAQSEPRP